MRKRCASGRWVVKRCTGNLQSPYEIPTRWKIQVQSLHDSKAAVPPTTAKKAPPWCGGASWLARSAATSDSEKVKPARAPRDVQRRAVANGGGVWSS
jgi:hypothetical protein